jgi:gliding motility-associated lipoprotein GldH
MDDFLGVHTLEDDLWEKGREIHHHFEVSDTSVTYDVYLEIHHTNFYPYSNIWTFLNTETPIGTVQRDTVGEILADEWGRWVTPHAMFIHRCRFCVEEGRRFPYPGRYDFSIRHGMRTDSLQGVRYVSLILRRH